MTDQRRTTKLRHRRELGRRCALAPNLGGGRARCTASPRRAPPCSSGPESREAFACASRTGVNFLSRRRSERKQSRRAAFQIAVEHILNAVMGESSITNHPVVSQERWVAEREKLLARETELTPLPRSAAGSSPHAELMRRCQ